MRVYEAQDVIEAQLVLDVLLEAGLKAELRNVNLVGSYPEVPVHPEVWLAKAADFDAARAIIDQFESNRKTIVDDVRCPKCKETNPGNFELCWNCRADLG